MEDGGLAMGGLEAHMCMHVLDGSYEQQTYYDEYYWRACGGLYGSPAGSCGETYSTLTLTSESGQQAKFSVSYCCQTSLCSRGT
jgi:hypothetical protein